MQTSAKSLLLILFAALASALAACGSAGTTTLHEAGSSEATLQTTTTGGQPTMGATGSSAVAVTTTTAQSAAATDTGTEEVRVGDWMVRLVSVTLDANTMVADFNEFNQPPDAGNQYVVATLAATRTAAGKASFNEDVYCSFRGSGGDSFEAAPVEVEDGWRDAAPIEQGATVTGNLVFQVASAQVAGGTLVLESSHPGDSPVLIPMKGAAK